MIILKFQFRYHNTVPESEPRKDSSGRMHRSEVSRIRILSKENGWRDTNQGTPEEWKEDEGQDKGTDTPEPEP